MGDNNFYGCYKTLFNADKDEFKEDKDGGIEFDGKEAFKRYVDKVYKNPNVNAFINANINASFLRVNDNQADQKGQQQKN